MSIPAEARFRCPGENYFIDRAIHLARLTGGFAACRACVHRFDAGFKPQGIVPGDAGGDVADFVRADPEGPVGVAHNEIDAARARQFGAAFGAAMRDAAWQPGQVRRVAVAADGRWLTAQLAAAVGEGLLRSGCRVVDTGASTSASLAMLVQREQLDGGVLVGNSSGASQIVSLKCWGPAAVPWSVGGGLDRVTSLLDAAPERGSRRSGGLERIDVAAQYREQLGDLFHGLRPLRFVLDTASAPLLEHLRHLAGGSALQILGPRTPAAGTLAEPARRKTKSAPPAARARLPAADHRARRAQRLREQVPADEADFGLWIDGDGDTLELVDQLGRPVNTERLLLALARHLASDEQSIAVVLEAEASHAASQQLRAAGARTIESSSNRQSMFVAMQRTGAALGGGPSGRLWFGGDSPHSDALRTLAELLQLLSQGDAALSDVLP